MADLNSNQNITQLHLTLDSDLNLFYSIKEYKDLYSLSEQIFFWKYNNICMPYKILFMKKILSFVTSLTAFVRIHKYLLAKKQI